MSHLDQPYVETLKDDVPLERFSFSWLDGFVAWIITLACGIGLMVLVGLAFVLIALVAHSF